MFYFLHKKNDFLSAISYTPIPFYIDSISSHDIDIIHYIVVEKERNLLQTKDFDEDRISKKLIDLRFKKVFKDHNLYSYYYDCYNYYHVEIVNDMNLRKFIDQYNKKHRDKKES